MKIDRYIAKYLAAGCALLLMALSAVAQEQLNTPAAYEMYKQRSLWMQSPNAAGAMIDQPLDYTQMSLGYRMVDGDFHRPQQGAKDNNLNLDVDGGVVLSKFYAWGRFTYDRNDVSDALYNASVIDPYRGMPYYIADANSSDWRNQFYDLQFRISTVKIANLLYLGVDGRYKVASGAKQRDLRTTNGTMNLELRPGVVFAPNERHSVGGNFMYLSYKEESRMEKVNEDNQHYYKMYGLGTSIDQIGHGQTSNFVGNTVGGGLQYNLRMNEFNILIGGKYFYRVEDVKNSFDIPRKDGTVKENRWEGNLSLYAGSLTSNLTHYVDLAYVNSSIDGIQYVSRLIRTAETSYYEVLYTNTRSGYKTQTASAAYSLTVNRGAEYNIKVGVGALYEKQNDIYYMPKSVFDVENVRFNLFAKKNFALGKRLSNRLLLGLGGVYKRNLSGKYYYNGVSPTSPIVTGLVTGDFNYLTTDYLAYNGSLTYSQKIKNDLKANLFVRVDYSYIDPVSSVYDVHYDNRTSLTATIGCNF